MTDSTKKSILSFVKKRINRNDIQIDIEEFEGEYYFVLMVDVAKTDKNSSEYDENYRKFVFNEVKKPRFAFMRGDILAPIISDLRQYMDIKITKTIFDFKNYDYISDIEKEINFAVKNTSQPQVKFEFSADSNDPYLFLTCYKFDFVNMNDGKKEFKEYLKEIEDVMGNKYDLTSYHLITRYTAS